MKETSVGHGPLVYGVTSALQIDQALEF
jgi:hypothetical protein